MKAILTKYIGPTNTKPARIKASAEGCGSETYTVDELEEGLEKQKRPNNTQELHALAARAYTADRGWPGPLTSGGLPNGDWAHCFLFNSEPLRDRVWKIDPDAGTQYGSPNHAAACREIARFVLQD
jgi:hypothetical protein